MRFLICFPENRFRHFMQIVSRIKCQILFSGENISKCRLLKIFPEREALTTESVETSSITVLDKGFILINILSDLSAIQISIAASFTMSMCQDLTVTTSSSILLIHLSTSCWNSEITCLHLSSIVFGVSFQGLYYRIVRSGLWSIKQIIRESFSKKLFCISSSNEYPQPMFLSRNKKNNVYVPL